MGGAEASALRADESGGAACGWDAMATRGLRGMAALDIRADGSGGAACRQMRRSDKNFGGHIHGELAFSSERLPTAATAAPGASSMARASLRAMEAQPRMPKRTGRGDWSGSGAAADEMDGGLVLFGVALILH